MCDISVVTPTYNRAGLLPRVWRSLRDQPAAFEWVVADDGSTDDTKGTVEGFDDPRIVFIALPENRGVNAARNAGVAASRGRHIVFLDSDDELRPGSLARMTAVMDGAAPEIGAAAFPCVMAATGEIVSRLPDGLVMREEDVVCDGRLGGGDKIFVYRRDVFARFSLPEDLRGCEHLFVYGIAKRFGILAVDEPMSVVHRQSDNLSSAKALIARSRDIALSYERVLRHHAGILADRPDAAALYLKRAMYRYGVAGARRDAWRVYKDLMCRSNSPLERMEATALLGLSLLGPGLLERIRIGRIDARLAAGFSGSGIGSGMGRES
jgi:glycosyltransferase involved in cell wall biosynthesis